MNFEALQKSWQTQPAAPLVNVNADVLLQMVRRNQRQFRSLIFWRDVREVGTAGVMTLVFLVWGLLWQWWSLDLLAFCCLGVGLFFVVDRQIQSRKKPAKSESMQACLEHSLFELNHQIWLLKNVFWWYLLPILIGLSAVSATIIWHTRSAGIGAMVGGGLFYLVVYGLVYGGVYWLNQRAVRKELEPRRRELEALLGSLQPAPGKE